MDNLSLPCSINVCQNNGKCYLLVNRSTTTHYCLCNRCFTGNQCEIERYSKNLWIYGISEENKKDYNPYNETIVLGILEIFSEMNGNLLHELYRMCLSNRESMFHTLKKEISILNSINEPLTLAIYLRFLNEVQKYIPSFVIGEK
ncbi:unnamed protein product [Rotaria sp. Silwood2]|nr:unnamed protein product [Rotaria sp. Silwood2]